MPGQVIKRGDNVWLIRVFTGRDAKGRRHYFNKTVRGTKKEADKYLRAKLCEQDLGVFVEPAAVSVDEYLDRWLEDAAKARLRERTLDGYSYLLKRHVRPAIGGRRLCDVRTQDVQHLYSGMQSRGLSARTVRYTHAVLSSALKQAVKWHMLAVNPCAAAELPRMSRAEMRALTPQEAAGFLAAAEQDEQGTVFAFALATGMRPEEYLALRWADVDLEKGTATVKRTLVWRKGGGWYYGEPKRHGRAARYRCPRR